MKRISFVALFTIVALLCHAQPGVINPANPPDPQPFYRLQVKAFPDGVCEPAVSISKNGNTLSMEYGGKGNIDVYAMAEADLQLGGGWINLKPRYRFSHWLVNDTIVSYEPFLEMTMPHYDITIVSVFEEYFNPTSPSDPGACYLNPTTGELFVDNFTPCNFSATINNIFDEQGYSRDDVKIVTAIGIIDMNMSCAPRWGWGVLFSQLGNCELVNLSQTSGYKSIPSSFFGDMANLRQLILPACIENFEKNSIYSVPQLRDIYLYALAPPILEEQSFAAFSYYGTDVNLESLTIHVPRSSLALYRAAAGWKDLNIVAIDNSLSLTVEFPENAELDRYRDMFIELTDTRSMQKQRMVITESESYTFSDIMNETVYEVNVRNQSGQTFATQQVSIVSSDSTVVLSELKRPLDMRLKVQDAEGTDVTGDVNIRWFSSDGSLLKSGPLLACQIEGEKINYTIELNDALSYRYEQPTRTEIVVGASTAVQTIVLEPIEQISLTGKVRDASSGRAIAAADIAFTQIISPKYRQLTTATTDAEGNFAVSLLRRPCTVEAKADDYENFNISVEELDTTQPLNIAMRAFDGTTIDITCKINTNDGLSTETYELNGQLLSIFNVTRGEYVNTYNLVGTRLLLPSLFKKETFRLVFDSNNFVGQEVEVVTDEQAYAKVQLTLTEKGSIKATYEDSEAAEPVAMLYDAKGKLIDSRSMVDTKASFEHLDAGNYTIVAMQHNSQFNSYGTLETLAISGLKENTDYVKQVVEVSAGKLQTSVFTDIPAFSKEANLINRITTSYNTNKQQIVSGQVITMRFFVDFTDELTDLEDIQLIIDLPDSAKFVDNAVLVNNALSEYSLTDSQLTIPLTGKTSSVRFCVIPFSSGEQVSTAGVAYSIGSERILQPAGKVSYLVTDAALDAYILSTSKQLQAQGITVPNSDVSVFDNNELVGKTQSLANGSWQYSGALTTDFNLSEHNVRAEILTPDGIHLKTKQVTLTFIQDMPELKSISMIYTNHSGEHKIMWDIQTGTVSPTYYDYDPNIPITFAAELITNKMDSIKAVTFLVNSDDGSTQTLTGAYSKEDGLWKADYLPTTAAPVNVRLRVEMSKPTYLADADLLASLYEAMTFFASYTPEQVNTDSLEQVFSAMIEREDWEGMCRMLGLSLSELSDSLVLTEDELLAILNDDSALDLTKALPRELIGDIPEMTNVVPPTISSAAGIDTTLLAAQGYVRIPKTDGSDVFVYQGDERMEIVDKAADVHIVVTVPSTAAANKIRQSTMVRGECYTTSQLSEINTYIETLLDLAKKVDETREQLVDLLKKSSKLQTDGLKKLATTIISKSPAGIKNMSRSIDFMVKSISRKVNFDILDILEGKALEKSHPMLSKTFAALGKFFNGFMSVKSVYNTCITYQKLFEQVNNLHQTIPERCKYSDKVTKQYNELAADVCYHGDDIYDHFMVAAGYQIGLCTATLAELVASPSGWIAVVSGTMQTTVSMMRDYIDKMSTLEDEGKIYMLEMRFTDLLRQCINQRPDTPIPTDPPAAPHDKTIIIEYDTDLPSVNGIRDPSGFVYETVMDNRVQDVEATIYYKPMGSDDSDKGTLWNATDFGQQNPLYTDVDGYYRWDVPIGLWQVRFQKDGYEPTQSEWLPVPPPQLEVNIPIVQKRQPMVVTAAADKQHVEFAFDKYMLADMLNETNVFVTENDLPIAGTIVLVDEVDAEGSVQRYARRVQFVPDTDFEAEQVTLTVSNRVMSYAGTQMASTYQQALVVGDAILTRLDDITPEQQTTTSANGSSATKVLLDGHLYILMPDGTIYTVLGNKVGSRQQNNLRFQIQ